MNFICTAGSQTDQHSLNKQKEGGNEMNKRLETLIKVWQMRSDMPNPPCRTGIHAHPCPSVVKLECV